MAYEKFYPEGWKDNEEGETPITAASLNHMDKGIMDAHTELAKRAEEIENLDKKDDNVLKEAKKYADDILAAAKKYSDANLTTSKSYTDSKAAALQASISKNASDISGLTTRMGGLSFSINAADGGLDITVL